MRRMPETVSRVFPKTRSELCLRSGGLTPDWQAYAEDGDSVDWTSIDASVHGKQRKEPRRPDLHD